MEKEQQKQNSIHPEVEAFRQDIPVKEYATVIIDFSKPLHGDVTSHIVHEVSKQGRVGFGHPLDVVMRDIMEMPDLPITRGKQKTHLGDAAIAEVNPYVVVQSGKGKK